MGSNAVSRPVKGRGADAPLEAPLRRRITFALIVALLLTLLIGAFYWRCARQIEADTSRIARTYAVMDGIEIISKNFAQAETSALGFSLSGEPELLTQYENGRHIIPHQLEMLRRLTADNPGQQRRLDELEAELKGALDFAANVVARASWVPSRVATTL